MHGLFGSDGGSSGEREWWVKTQTKSELVRGRFRGESRVV